jgi:hypothetical protein
VPADSVLVDPIVIAPAPIDATPIQVDLTDVSLDLIMNWSPDGTVWLLPACNFTTADGISYVVIAVDDAYVEQPAAVTPEPGVIEPAPAPDTAVPVEPGATEPGAAEPGAGGSIDPAAAADALVGLSQADAEAAATAEGWGLRVVRLDGEDLPATMDFNPQRVNVAVVNGVVTEVLSIG